MAQCPDHGIETAAVCESPAGLCQRCQVDQLADPARPRPGMLAGVSPLLLRAALVGLLMLLAACAGCSAVVKALPHLFRT